MSDLKKVLWPIDPYIDDTAGDKNVVQFLKNLGKVCPIEVIPVHVVSSILASYLPNTGPADQEKLRQFVRQDCDSYLESIDGKNFLKDTIVLDNLNFTKSSEIFKFEEFVGFENPDFVVLASHGRKGVSRFFLGSFTENFLRRTETPTFVVNSKMDCNKSLKKALLPVSTDEASRKFLEHFLDVHALSFVGSLQLFHKLPLIDYVNFSWVPEFYTSIGFPGAQSVPSAEETAKTYFSSVMNHPLSQKRLSFTIGAEVDTVADSVIFEAKKLDSGMIVVRTQAGPVERRVFGSFSLDIVRSSLVPVLVYPYHYKEQI